MSASSSSSSSSSSSADFARINAALRVVKGAACAVLGLPCGQTTESSKTINAREAVLRIKLGEREAPLDNATLGAVQTAVRAAVAADVPLRVFAGDFEALSARYGYAFLDKAFPKPGSRLTLVWLPGLLLNAVDAAGGEVIAASAGDVGDVELYPFEGAPPFAGCATALSIPVITTEQNPTRLGSTVAELCLPSPAIPKTRFSMLTNEVLRTLSDETCHVVLCGIEAHVCIAQTAHDLLREGFKVHIVVDGVSSQRRGDRAIALSALASAGAQLTSTEAVAFALLGDAAHPSFKEVQRLVMTHSRETLEADNTAGAVRLDTLV